MTDGPITIWHNPDCGTSRNVLAMIRQAGIDPVVRDYRRDPPSAAELRDALAALGLPARALLRRKGTPYDALGLDDPSLDDDAVVAAMAAHPILIERPVVFAPRGTALCRPSETVRALLPPGQPAFAKEDGTVVPPSAGGAA